MNANEILLIVAVVTILMAFRLYVRNLNKKAGKNGDVRLGRIQAASWRIQFVIGVSFLFGLYWILAFCLGWPFLSQSHVMIVISHDHIYASLSEMPKTILIWWALRMVLSFLCFGVLFSLFRLYRLGILFSAKNVRHIQFLAYLLIAQWAVDYGLQASLRDMDLSFTPLFVGSLIIFIAWIMDEGRKIQEEQELTV